MSKLVKWTDEQIEAEVVMLEFEEGEEGDEFDCVAPEDAILLCQRIRDDLQSQLNAANDRTNELTDELISIYSDRIEVAEKVSAAGAQQWDLRRFKELTGRDYHEGENE